VTPHVRIAIRPVRQSDAPQYCEIYNYYVRETVITFEEQPVDRAGMERRIVETSAMFPWLVAEHGGVFAGCAYATSWKTRSAYRYAVESSVYLAPDATGRGIGTELYAALLAELRARGLHCAIGGIALPNPASIALHEKLGFRKIGEFAEVGWKLGRWIDVGYWELVF
jgi:L-amino acid N-acyltransferase YncA